MRPSRLPKSIFLWSASANELDQTLCLCILRDWTRFFADAFAEDPTGRCLWRPEILSSDSIYGSFWFPSSQSLLCIAKISSSFYVDWKKDIQPMLVKPIHVVAPCWLCWMDGNRIQSRPRHLTRMDRSRWQEYSLTSTFSMTRPFCRCRNLSSSFPSPS
jgi:hypothetical protein